VGGGVKFLVAPVPDGVCQAVGAFTLIELIVNALAQFDLVDVAQ
jgi:hypothetical protein